MIDDRLTLAIDVGTGSVRAARGDARGGVIRIESREHEQVVPRYGWSEQRPADWWSGVVEVVRRLTASLDHASHRIEALCACGQMHGTVLLDGDGRLVRETAPLWNDKRTLPYVERFEAEWPPDSYLAACANTPTPAWPAFKLQWLRDHDPDAYARTRTVLMPKDYVNFRLTGERATDWTEASCSFLMDPAMSEWSATMIDRLGLDAAKLAPIRMPQEVLGRVTAEAAAATGLPSGLPVLVGGGDYPIALLGSGANRPGLGSDVTGTSTIITQILSAPILAPDISNVAIADGLWGAFVLLDSGGDAMRWARRAMHENAVSYAAMVDKAADAPAGADALFFLPYLAGARLGPPRHARAQFFGITPRHGLPHLHRAVLEGVAFSAARHLRIMEAASGRRMERIIAAGGGAKTRLWLEIKASLYGVPIVVPVEPECGVIGCAALAATATGRFGRLDDAVAAFVRYGDDIAPNPAWTERYARMQTVFNSLYRNSQSQYDLLDALADEAQEEVPLHG